MRTELFIAGEWRTSSLGATFPVLNPATGAVLAHVADGDPAEAAVACDAAAASQPAWAATAPRDRSELLRACWATMLDHAEELAQLITAEHGKPLADARAEVTYAAEFFRWNAEETVRVGGQLSVAPSGANRILVRHPPVGVVVMVTPWNFPAAMITRKLAPALGAGNSVVIKPPKEAPLTALRIAALLHAVGLPAGTLNVVPTSRSAAWFDAAVDHPATRMVSFTGSTEVGRQLLRRASDRVLKVVMELGGNAPFVVFADADLDAAVEGAMVAKMRHSGETCTAANRFYVEASVADEFAVRLGRAMGAVEIGDGTSPGVTCGPMINAAAVDELERLVRDAVGEGARIVVGGRRGDGPGTFYEPTVLTDVPSSAAIVRAEIFGPVAPIVAFDDDETMIRQANDTEMGLAAYVYTGDLAKGLRTAERLEAGMVGVNRGSLSDPAAPFGGMKQSGLGREGAGEGIYEFCETQYIATSW